MKLAARLFISYLIVIGVTLAIIAITTAYTTPINFTNQMMHSGPMMGGMMRGSGSAVIEDLINEEIEAAVQDAVNKALLRSSVVAILVAGVISLLISQRITRPIRHLAQASQQLAIGQSPSAVTHHSTDEIGDLTRAFNQMAASLAHTETMRQQLIADISHELKTPLASIKGYMEGLQDGVIPATDETFTRIHHEADRLQRLVHDLQELSRAEAGQILLERQPLDLRTVIETTTDWLKPQFEGKSIALQQDLPMTPVQVLGDYDRLRQVLLNLLGNALQYTPEGGTVSVKLGIEGHQARLAVSDTGAGIAPEHLERIFERFYRVDKSRSRSSGGSGIGLTVSQHIVKAHDGIIHAESPGNGLGSTFQILLPIFTETS